MRERKGLTKMEEWKTKALKHVNAIYEALSKAGISVYKNYMERDTWLLVEIGHITIEISCAADEIYLWKKLDGKTQEDKTYKKAGWVNRYIKGVFDDALASINDCKGV